MLSKNRQFMTLKKYMRMHLNWQICQLKKKMKKKLGIFISQNPIQGEEGKNASQAFTDAGRNL